MAAPTSTVQFRLPARLAAFVFSGAVLLGSAVPVAASPFTILSVTAGDLDVGTLLLSSDPADPKALAASFSLGSALANASISVELACLQCQAEFFRMQTAIGPGSDFVTNLIGVATVDTLGGGGFFKQTTPLFSGLSLDAGTYFLVMSLTDQSISGGVWAATQSPVVNGVAGATNLNSRLASTADYNSTTPPLSTFVPYEENEFDTFLQFTVANDPATTPVPEPASVLLVLAGIAIILCRRFLH